MVKYHRGISLARWYTKGWPRQPRRRYYFVGRLTNDYAGPTFARTKKTLSLNHKEPLPEARTPHIIHGHLDEGFADPFVFSRHPFVPSSPSRRDLSSSKEDSFVFIFLLMSLFLRTANTFAWWILQGKKNSLEEMHCTVFPSFRQSDVKIMVKLDADLTIPCKRLVRLFLDRGFKISRGTRFCKKKYSRAKEFNRPIYEGVWNSRASRKAKIPSGRAKISRRVTGFSVRPGYMGV